MPSAIPHRENPSRLLPVLCIFLFFNQICGSERRLLPCKRALRDLGLRSCFPCTSTASRAGRLRAPGGSTGGSTARCAAEVAQSQPRQPRWPPCACRRAPAERVAVGWADLLLHHAAGAAGARGDGRCVGRAGWEVGGWVRDVLSLQLPSSRRQLLARGLLKVPPLSLSSPLALFWSPPFPFARAHAAELRGSAVLFGEGQPLRTLFLCSLDLCGALDYFVNI